MDFTGKVVLVTGASRGIGRAIALQFAEKGAVVAIHYHRNLDAAHETRALLPGEGHRIVQADLTNPIAIQEMINLVVAEMGALHILVNNAGMYEEHPADEVDYDTWIGRWEMTIQTNLLGPAHAAYCAAQHMIRQGGGRIVNVSSRGAFRGEPAAPAYGASKAGLNAMGQSLAKALAPHNIFVTTVAPGWVETDMAADELNQADGAAIKSQSPLNRIARPEEVAYTVLFLASEGAEFLTGAIVDVNGASYLRT
ncbi:MAG: SDR family oxidoreductase [Anaerolineae bacterium]